MFRMGCRVYSYIRSHHGSLCGLKPQHHDRQCDMFAATHFPYTHACPHRGAFPIIHYNGICDFSHFTTKLLTMGALESKGSGSPSTKIQA